MFDRIIHSVRNNPSRRTLWIIPAVAFLATLSLAPLFAQQSDQESEQARALKRLMGTEDRNQAAYRQNQPASVQNQPANRQNQPGEQARAPGEQAQASGEQAQASGEQAQASSAARDLRLNLSGNQIKVETLPSGEIILIGPSTDLDILTAFLDEIDKQLPQKEFRLIVLENAGAQQIAEKLEPIINSVWPGLNDLPNQSISIFAISANKLYIVGPESRLDRVAEIARAIDEIPDVLPEFELMKFKIKFARATEVKEQLEEVIQKLQAIQGADENEQITITVNDADNSVTVFAPSKLRVRVQSIIDSIDVEPTAGAGHIKLAIYPLFNAESDKLADVLTEMLESSTGQESVQETIRRLSIIKRGADGALIEFEPLDLTKPLRIIDDKGTNSLIVATIEQNIAPLGEIIELLDSYPTGHDLAMRVFPLKFADAESVLDTLKTMFDEGKKLPERAPGGSKTEAVPETEFGSAVVYNVGLAVDKRTNTLIVSGRPAQIEIAGGVIAELDVPVSSVKFPLRLLFLGDHADASRVAAIVQELFDKRIELLGETDAGALAIAREQVFLAVDVRSNALIVSASEQNHAEIERISKQLNVAGDRLIDTIRIINCENTNAADLASKIDELWARKAALRSADDQPEDTPVIVSDLRTNALIIASNNEDFAEIETLVSRLERQPLSPIAEIRLLTLENNDATQVSDMLKSLFEERMQQRLATGQVENPADRIAVSADATTNTILVASSRENYDEILRLVEVIDVVPALDGVIRIFVLENAVAADVTEKLKDLFDQGLFRSTAGVESELVVERNKVTIMSDARSNAIVVSASKSNLSIAQSLIEQMDGELSPLLNDETKIIQLAHADAVKLSEMLKTLFDERQAEAAEPDLFRKPTLIADERSNTIVLSGTQDAMTRCIDLIGQLDTPAGPPSATFEVYTLEFGSAAKLATKMQDLFEKRNEGRDDNATPINVTADEASNSLIASASRDDHLLIESLLKLLDQPSNIAKQFEIFPLSMAKAESVAETLDQLFQQQSDGAQGTAAAIAVQPDVRSNALVVWAGASEMENIATIIKKLDRAEPVVDMMVKVIRLKQALAEDFADMLDETLNGGDNSDENAVILSFVESLPDGTFVTRKLIRQDISITPDPRTNSVLVMAPSASMGMLESLIMEIDRIKPITAEIRFFPLKNADADEIVDKLDAIFGTDDQGDGSLESRIVFGGDGGAAAISTEGSSSTRQPLRFTADRRTNAVIAAGNAIDLRMAEELINALDAQDIQNRVQTVYRTNYVPAADIASALESFADSENQVYSELDDQTSIRVRAERTVSVVSDETSNAVLFAASPKYYDDYMDLIRKIDRPEPQVMISVLIAEVSINDRAELGVEFAAQDLLFSEKATVGGNGVIQGSNFDIVGGTDIGAAGVGFGGLSLTVSGEDFAFLFRALQSEGQLEILSRPTLLVQNNAEGNITIGDQVPIISGSTSAGGQSSTTIQYQDVGIILNVTPHINPDGYVNLEINPEISQISNQTLQVAEGLNAAVISERSADTTVTVKDGQTVILGGLITETVEDTVVKAPFLGDLPGIGWMFRSTTQVSNKTELLIVLTVSVIRNEEDLQRLSEEERDITGRFPERIKRSPLMKGLRIKAEDDPFGPVGGHDDHTPLDRPQPARRDRSIYGPMPGTYGPPRPTAAGQMSNARIISDARSEVDRSENRRRVYGPRIGNGVKLVKSEGR